MSTHPRLQRVCLWSLPVALVFTFGGMAIAGWMPPPFPGESAEGVARHYSDNADAIRVGSVLIFIGGVLLVPTMAVVSLVLRRVEGGPGPMSVIQMLTGVLGPLAFIVPCFLWAGAAFDPGRAPEITKALHDVAWIGFIAGIWSFSLQNAAVSAAILAQRGRPTLPRWLAYLGMWAAVLYMPSCLVLFFDEGPFAWNGVFTFWLAAVAFTVWNLTLIAQIDGVFRRDSAGGAPESLVAPRVPAATAG